MNILNRIKFGSFLRSITINKIDTLSGVEFEKFVADFFDYLGYKTTLTVASGDNGIDIISKSRRYSIGIQTKLYYNHNVNNKAIQEVYSGKNYYNLDYALAITNWKFSAPSLNLAKTLKVGTIDRKGLEHMLNNDRKKNVEYIKSILEEISE